MRQNTCSDRILKKFSRFKGLRVERLNQKFSSLEVWQLGGLKRQLPWDFICPDFINPFNHSTIQLFNRKRYAFAQAFTMAEILVSLTIIGVIAAITLPALQANINEKTWAAQRKALYSRMSQAILLMPTLNSYGIGADDAETNEKAGMDFVTNGLSKVLKIKNICDADNLKKCGIPTKYKAYKSSTKLNFPTNMRGLNDFVSTNNNPQKNINTKVTAFETANGESVAVFYNPYCVNSDIEYYTANFNPSTGGLIPWPYFCINFVYDLNGLKGPNQVGKDIWYMSTLYSDRMETIMLEPNRISPRPENASSMTYLQAKEYCASIDARIPTVEEGLVANYNLKLANFNLGFLRNTKDNKPYVIYSAIYGGFLRNYGSSGVGVRCIYRK